MISPELSPKLMKMSSSRIDRKYISTLETEDRLTLFKLCHSRFAGSVPLTFAEFAKSHLSHQIDILVLSSMRLELKVSDFLAARLVELSPQFATLDTEESTDMLAECAKKFGMTVDEVLHTVDPVADERRRQVLGFLCVDPAKWSVRGPRVTCDFTRAIMDECSSRIDKCDTVSKAIARDHVECLRRCVAARAPPALNCFACREPSTTARYVDAPLYIALMEENIDCFRIALDIPECRCVQRMLHGILLKRVLMLSNPEFWLDLYVEFVKKSNINMAQMYRLDTPPEILSNYAFAVDAFDKLGFGPTAAEWNAAANTPAGLEHIRNKTLKRPYPWLELYCLELSSSGFFRGLPSIPT